MNTTKFRVIAAVVFVVLLVLGYVIYQSNNSTPKPQGDPDGLVIH